MPKEERVEKKKKKKLNKRRKRKKKEEEEEGTKIGLRSMTQKQRTNCYGACKVYALLTIVKMTPC